MAETIQFIDERLDNSITAVVPPSNPIDRLQPLTFTDWLKHNTQLFTTASDFLNRYQVYLNNWYTANNATVEQASQGVKTYYTNLINEIVINYTSVDEQRYLKNIDINNSRDLAIAVPFFAKKIKDICLYYGAIRDNAQAAAVQYNLKGSNTGIENLLYVNILKALQTQDITTQFGNLNYSIESISNNIEINIEDLYDTYTDYYDVSPTLPASAYNTTSGLRNDFFELNQVDLDPYLDININQSVLKAILSYPFYTIELGSNNFSIDPLVNSTQLDLLKDSDFISTVNDQVASNLNLVVQNREQSKYMGTDYHYIVVTSSRTAYTSGVLFTADNEFANVLNKRYPTIAAVPSSEFLKTAKEIGLFFKPDKIGLTNFTNFNFAASIDVEKLQPSTVYYYPDPAKYGNISGNSKVEFQAPLTFFEKNYFNKIDYSNQYRFGDAATDPYYQTFRAYQTKEQSRDYSNAGIQRYVDSQDFFTGDQDALWNNIDAYPLTPYGTLPIENKTEALTPTNKTLIQYKGDVYGNQYGLYKAGVNKQFSTIARETSFLDYVFDGFVFNLTAADISWPGWSVANSAPTNVNYAYYGSKLSYSGVTLKTSVTEIIGPDGNTPVYTAGLLPDGSGYIDDGGSFNDGGNAIIIESYDFKTNDSIYGFTAPTLYTCIIRDAEVFTKSNNSFLPDVPSDTSTYNSNKDTLYYNTLADAAPQPASTDGVANFDNQASFLINPDAYVTEIYDGNVFWDSNINTSPCNNTSYSYAYNEPTNFINSRLANSNTELDRSLSGINVTKNSLYVIKNVEYGDFYFRNASSTIIGPVSSTLSAAFMNFSDTIKNEIYNNIINFDLYYDTLQIETENYLIFNKIKYDYDNNQIIGAANAHTIIPRGSQPELEKFSTVWFDERSNSLLVAATTLHYQLSASNYKALYPTIYSIDISSGRKQQVYPVKSAGSLTFNELSAFSLYGKNIELNIVRAEKPVLNYSEDTGYYTLTYLAKDPANCFYIVTIRFQFLQGIIQNITSTLHKPATDVYHINFANRFPNNIRLGSPYFDTYTVIGSAAGFIDTADNTFTWGYNTN
jgi:hypothetical protein